MLILEKERSGKCFSGKWYSWNVFLRGVRIPTRARRRESQLSTRDGVDNKKCICMLRRVRKPCSHAAPHRIQTQLSSRCTAPQVTYSSNFHKHQKKISSLAYDIQKIDFGGIILDSFWRGGPLKPCQTICFFKHLLIKETNALAWANQKLIFGGLFGSPWGGGTPKVCQNICRWNIYWYKKKLLP